VAVTDFEAAVAPFRGELHAYCYRMLGSVHDADDALQDAMLRAWRGIDRFEGRSSLRAWLYKIATNASLDVIAKRPKRVLPMDVEDDAEPLWLEPYPDPPEASIEQRETVELAFVAAVQHLPGTQRAALLLRDVLGFRSREVASLLDTSEEAVNSALARARRVLRERMPERSQQETLRALGDEGVRELVQRYMKALESGDIERIVALLSQDATWSMPPLPAYYRGLAEIRGFLRDGPARQRWRHIPAAANGQLAVGCYIWNGHRFAPFVIDVLTLDGPHISAVTAFIDPSLFEPFGLPAAIP
jgi:RNA polymerase sigma-70 factor (ECF subfamily)